MSIEPEPVLPPLDVHPPEQPSSARFWTGGAVTTVVVMVVLLGSFLLFNASTSPQQTLSTALRNTFNTATPINVTLAAQGGAVADALTPTATVRTDGPRTGVTVATGSSTVLDVVKEPTQTVVELPVLAHSNPLTAAMVTQTKAAASKDPALDKKTREGIDLLLEGKPVGFTTAPSTTPADVASDVADMWEQFDFVASDDGVEFVNGDTSLVSVTVNREQVAAVVQPMVEQFNTALPQDLAQLFSADTASSTLVMTAKIENNKIVNMRFSDASPQVDAGQKETVEARTFVLTVGSPQPVPTVAAEVTLTPAERDQLVTFAQKQSSSWMTLVQTLTARM